MSDGNVTIQRLGNEGEPLVIIDQFSGMTEELRKRAAGSTFQQAGAFYPGLRAPALADFVDERAAIISEILARVFDLREPIALELLAFALVSTPRANLRPTQTIPHYDSAVSNVVAGMLYLLDANTGGTAFYRHRKTGFEAITQDRERDFRAAVQKDLCEQDQSPPDYKYGDCRFYELIGEVEARPDRLALYRGRLLHSGVVPAGNELSPDPAKGRLTMNLFFRGN